MSLEKAKIVVYGENDTKKEEIPVLFNPAEYSINESATYSEKNIPGLGGAITQFISGAKTTLTMTLMFDTYQTFINEVTGAALLSTFISELTDLKPMDVSKQTRKITSLTKIEGKLHSPPKCAFVWGSLKFEGIVTSVNQTYTMFMDNGMPVRAKLDVTFQSILGKDLNQKQSPFESPDRTKYRVLEQGMQIWNMAWHEYGDVEMWREIAKANGIMNPRNVYSGQKLVVPSL